MSAIAGIIHFDGSPVEQDDLQRMSQALQPFGRDGVRIVKGDDYGLVVRLSHITPEDLFDRQPVLMRNRDFLIFQGRLDNRAELIAQLGLAGEKSHTLADSALAGKAWEAWGKNTCGKLIGNFSLAHWCTSYRQLCLVRSAPRGNPVYVYRQGHRLYFASVPQALFALPKIPRGIDEESLAEILLGLPSHGRTLFKDIHQVCNSHYGQYQADGERMHQYWFPDDPNRNQRFNREEEAWEAFASIFESVVREQLRSNRPAGIMMSGGLDSSALAGQAASILAGTGKTLSGYTRVPMPDYKVQVKGLRYDDERPRVEAIAGMLSTWFHPFCMPARNRLLTLYAGGFPSPTFLQRTFRHTLRAMKFCFAERLPMV